MTQVREDVQRSVNIASILQCLAADRGSQLALIDGRRSLTYAQLCDKAARAAADLRAAGLRADDRALVFCPMSVELYVTLIGILWLGAVAVFVDPSAGRARIDEWCDELEPRAFVAVRRAHVLRLISRRVRRIPLKIAIGGGVPYTASTTTFPRPHAASVPPTVRQRRSASPAVITFTSGSTGPPRAAVRSHAFLLAQHHILAEDLQLHPGDVDLATLPAFVLANLASGVTSVIPATDIRSPAAIDPVPLLRQIRARRPNRAVASPALLERLVDGLDSTGERLDLTRIFTGGAPVVPALLDSLARVAPRATITAVYGSTEAEPVATLNRDDITEVDRAGMRAGAGLLAGRPVSSIELRILPDRWGTPLGPYSAERFEAEAVPRGRHGEIVVAGPHVMTGYLNGRGDIETKIHVDDRVWHRTGDAGYIDGDGRLWLLGRCAAKVSDAHGIVYPLAVECAAGEIPGVERVAFVQHRGRRVLVAELHPNVLPRGAPVAHSRCSGARPESRHESALSELRRRLEWVHLEDVVVVDRIPVDRRHNGKVDYPALKTMLERG